MGFRLYIGNAHEPENNDICYGKCYCYNRGVHLYSLDYLIAIDAFKDWSIGPFDKNDYEELMCYFSCTQITDMIYLTREEYERFISLYLSDQQAVWGDSCDNVFNPNDSLNIIRIYWC